MILLKYADKFYNTYNRIYFDEYQDSDDFFESTKKKLVNKEKITKKITTNLDEENDVEIW